MTEEIIDPNADLMGYEFLGDDGLTYKVTHTWDILAAGQYVICSVGPGDGALRLASAVRRRKQLEAG